MSPRKFKIPLNIPITFRGERVEFPVVAVIGFIGIVSILVFTLLTHRARPHRRTVLARPGLIVLPLLPATIEGCRCCGSQQHDWRSATDRYPARAGELELMDEYIANVKASDERRAEAQP